MKNRDQCRRFYIFIDNQLDMSDSDDLEDCSTYILSYCFDMVAKPHFEIMACFSNFSHSLYSILEMLLLYCTFLDCIFWMILFVFEWNTIVLFWELFFSVAFWYLKIGIKRGNSK